MSATLHLVVRGIRRRGWDQVLALVLVCALAAAAVVAGLAAQTSAADRVDAAYEKAGGPDLVLYGDQDALGDLEGDPAIAEASTPWPFVSDLTIRIDDEEVELDVFGQDPDHLPPVGTPDLVAGRWPTAADEVVAEQSLISTDVTDVGGTITLTTEEGPVERTVVGAAVDLTDCFWPTCDPVRVFARPEDLGSLTADGEPTAYQAAYRLVDPDAAATVGGRFLADPDSGVAGANSWPDTREDILILGTVFSSLVGAFGVFLLIAAALVVAGATAARLVARRRTLGLLAATGFTPRQLLFAVWAEHLVLGAVGVLIGWAIGTAISPVVEAGLADVLPGDQTSWTLRPFLIALVLVGAVLSVSVLVPAWRATHQAPTTVLRDAPPTPTGGRRIAGLARRLSAGPSTVCGLRRSFARPGRAALAGGALLVATAGTIVSIGFLGTIDAVEADPAVIGNPWDIAVEADTSSPDEVAAVLDETPGVATWFTEREQTGIVDGNGFTVRMIGAHPDAAEYVVQEGRAMEADDEALVGYGFLDETGLDVGDPLTLDLDGTVLDLTIVGWYSDTADTGKMIQVLESGVPASAFADDPEWRVVIDDGADADHVANELNRRLAGGAVAQPLTVQDLVPARVAMMAMAGLLALVALANLLATTLSSTRERARAIGVLRTVGCSTSQLVGQSAVGGAGIGLLAALVGVPLGLVAYTALTDGLTAGIGIGPGFATSPSTLVLVLIVPASVALAALAGALATIGLARRPASVLVRYE